MLILKNYTIKKKVEFRFCIKTLGFIFLILIYICYNNVNSINKRHKNNNRIETEECLSDKRLLVINDAKQASTRARLWRCIKETSENSEIGYKQFSQNEKKNTSHDRVHENKSINNVNSVTLKKEEYILKNEHVENNTSGIDESNKRKKKEKCFLLEFFLVFDSALEDIVFSTFDAIKNYRNSRCLNKKNLRKRAYKKICALLALPILSILMSFFFFLNALNKNLYEYIYLGLFSIGGLMILYIFIKVIIYAFFVKRDLKRNKYII
ncbi:hypothetical protein PVMG_06252 [Plasmodium vivax Mauritania I]|uniref:Uncharacterized protein n=1 Tax=Plasmodium vivax Mauritania I TaxID=1035515 RepID=A0A0J9T4P1_PLAVI|nr:hypothetical protein PVMG_06252 [Plasmodium vivax Mauritania I]